MSDEEEKPLFLKAPEPETWKKPEDKSWGDWFLHPGKTLSFRHRQVALMKAMGARNNMIAKKLDFCESRVSTLLSNKKIIAEIEKYQDKMFAESVEERLKGLAPLSMDHMEKVLDPDNDDRNITTSHKNEISKWVAEKVSGKAKQELEVTGNLIGNLIDQLDLLKVQEKTLNAQGEIIDVTPEGGASETEEQDQWAKLLDTYEGEGNG